jgi:hypothetical protein
MKSTRRRGLLLPCLFFLGTMSLSYLAGAAVVHFKLPTSEYLDEAFTGAQAWLEQRKEAAVVLPDATATRAAPDVDKPAKTFDGFTVYTTDRGAQAVLMDMHGKVRHRWAAPFSQVWPTAPHVKNRVADAKIYFFACHLYPNGDLLAVYHGNGDTPYGYGLVKLDRDSRVLWRYSANAHHGLDVGEDGTIYVLTQQMVRDLPPGLEFITTPCLADYLVLLSPEGEELKKVPLLEAFRDSPHALQLSARGRLSWDVLHTNAVEVLRRDLAPRYPLFKAGQVLLSVRELDAVAVLDTDRGAVVWAARGPWRRQHDPHFLDNGRLLLFDNLGSTEHSRVVEYDPHTQACPWSYAGEDSPPFVSPIQGRCQRLPNGNTLLVNSKEGQLLEVTRTRELVWSCSLHTHLPWARRYAPAHLTFLEGVPRARP